MTQETESRGVLLSALADGQLRGEQFARTLGWLECDQEARQTWDVYHLVGDVLRSGESMASPDDIDFLQRLKAGLQQEVVLATRLGDANSMLAGEVDNGLDEADRLVDRAANDANGRWKLLAGLASLVAVLVIGWQLTGGLKDQSDAQLVMIRDPQLDALLTAHRQSDGGSALQMSGGFLRNATFEGTGR